MDMYPDAKIILNQRADAAAWGKSVDESLMFFSSWAYRIATCLIKTDRLNAEMQLATFDVSYFCKILIWLLYTSPCVNASWVETSPSHSER